MSRNCKCGLPPSQCVWSVQRDWVKNNGLPCVLPKNEAEAAEYAEMKRERVVLWVVRKAHLAFLDLLTLFMFALLLVTIGLAFYGG